MGWGSEKPSQRRGCLSWDRSEEEEAAMGAASHAGNSKHKVLGEGRAGVPSIEEGQGVWYMRPAVITGPF